MYHLAVDCIVLTALLAYLSQRLFRLPITIGVMALSLALSLVLIGLDRFGLGGLHDREVRLLGGIDFSRVVMQGMLSVLLFAGALHVDLGRLRAYRWQVALLALLGTAISTAIVGVATWYVLPLFGLRLDLAYCFVFGALISPTDPVSVIGILRSAGAPESLETVIVGESLFNDGIGVVLFVLLTGIAAAGRLPAAGEAGALFLREAGGGIGFGLALGTLTYWMLRSIDSYQEEALLTLAAVLGGYALADSLHVSGPIAMVVAGLIVGNQGRSFAMSEKTRIRLDLFWDLLDVILNAVLFVLIGLQVVLVAFTVDTIAAGAALIVVTLVARAISVGLPVATLPNVFRLVPGSWRVLTWGGLRGGISVALALSLPQGPERDLILVLTYSIVLFSVLAQGLTIGRVARKLPRDGRRDDG